MTRKIALVAAAIAVLGAASLAGTAPALAKGKGFGGGFHHHHHGHFRGFGWGGPVVSYYDSCLRRVWAVNRFGELVRRTVNVCY
jgi:hypothetical protein